MPIHLFSLFCFRFGPEARKFNTALFINEDVQRLYYQTERSAVKCHLPQHLFNTNAKRFFNLLFMDKQIDELWKGFSINLIIISLDDFSN